MEDPSLGRRVLLVDDHVDGADMTAEVLRAQGWDVSIAHHPFVALALVVTFRPQIAVLDIGLPCMDGHELGRQIRLLAPGCQLIAMTGHVADSYRLRSFEAGFAAHLVKPFPMQLLLLELTKERRILPIAATM